MNAFEIMDALGGVPAELVETGLQEAPSENAGKRRSSPKRMILRAASAAAAVIAVVIGVRYVRIRAVAGDSEALKVIGVDASQFHISGAMPYDLSQNCEVLGSMLHKPRTIAYAFNSDGNGSAMFDSSYRLISYSNGKHQDTSETELPEDTLMETAVQIAQRLDAGYQYYAERSNPDRLYYFFRKMIGADAYDAVTLLLNKDGSVRSFVAAYCDLDENFSSDSLDAKIEKELTESVIPAYQEKNSNYQGYEITNETFYFKNGWKTYAMLAVNFEIGDGVHDTCNYLIAE